VQLGGFLDGTIEETEKTVTVITNVKTETKTINPAYEHWLVHDQPLLGFLVSSMTKEVLAQVGASTSVYGLQWRANQSK
jgi:hypothetical protein